MAGGPRHPARRASVVAWTPLAKPTFAKQVCIVTGGASGLGRELCVQLAAAGATVILSDLDGARATAAAATMTGAVTVVACDVTDAASVQALIDGTVADFGRIDYLFNNAGVAVMGEIRDLSLAQWRRVIETNLFGVIHGVHHAYPHMIFATSRQPHVAGRITADTTWDAAALWQRLPDLTRHVLATMLEGDSSALRLTRETLDVLLGPSGGLRAPGAAEAIVADLDRLLVIARVMEDVWDIDPPSVGIGRRVWAPEPPPPPPVPVVARDAAVIARLAGPARDAMVARHTAETIPLFPAADPLRNRLSVKDKVVLLPASPPSRWVNDGIHRAIPIGSEADGWYFVRTDDDGCARVLAAVERHRRATSTDVGDAAYEIIGRITGDPSMVVVDGSARIGHAVSVLGARIGIHLFVDATLDFAGRSPYAGED